MKKLLLLLLLCISINAQTTLSVGDIAIVRMNEDSPSDGFSFVTLVPISAGTIIYFAEEGWLGAPSWNVNSESHLKYTAPAGGLSAGNVVHVDETTTADVFSITGAGGTITFAWGTSNFNLSSGDQILVYQTSEASKPASPTFIAGLTMNDGNSVTEPNDPATGWTSAGATNETGVSVSRLPSGLVNGSTCISVFPDYLVLAEKDNARYNCTSTSGTKSQLLAAINNHDNWLYDDAANYATSSVCSFTVSSAVITFANGSSFSQSISSGNSDQVLGRFKLTGNISGSYLTAATIKLINARSGLSNFRLWTSEDASFGGDTQLGSTVAADPGDGNSVTFNGFSSHIAAAGTYYFLTADVSSNPSGTVQGVIIQNSSLTISEDDGTISGTISNDLLSNNSGVLPVEITAFSADLIEESVILKWQTAMELNNFGFEIERKLSSNDEDWQFIGFVQGYGNSNSPKQYSFVDKNFTKNNYLYRLKQLDNDGNYVFSNSVEISINLLPKEYELSQNYPNPFNPTTTIKYSIPSNGIISLKVFDVLGNEVTTLVNASQNIGSYEVNFDASKLSSGTYFYQLKSGNFTVTKKLLLLK